MLERVITLKENIEKNLDVLKDKYPLSPLIAESISILIEMEADESDILSWTNNQRIFIRDIEKEIKLIEEKKCQVS